MITILQAKRHPCLDREVTSVLDGGMGSSAEK